MNVLNISGLLWRFSASIFCDFWKISFCNFTAFFSRLTKATLWFSDVIQLTISYLCPNMNHFDSVDFSERHSEEIISFFWRSVYIFNVTEMLYDRETPLLIPLSQTSHCWKNIAYNSCWNYIFLVLDFFVICRQVYLFARSWTLVLFNARSLKSFTKTHKQTIYCSQEWTKAKLANLKLRLVEA